MSESKPTPHPATFSALVLDAIKECLGVVGEALPDLDDWSGDEYRILDPFAGIGKVHTLGLRSVGVELEPEWAYQHRQNLVHDSRRLPFPDRFFDGIVTSPAYGNRLADHHEAKDASKRITYRHKLGRALTDGNSGMMHWGKDYRTLHRRVWAECRRVTVDEGFFILNISDHVRAGEVVPVADWHEETLYALRYELIHRVRVETPRMRYGANHDVRVEHELVNLYAKMP